jgi:uncharacterized protein (TIGR02145 family)
MKTFTLTCAMLLLSSFGLFAQSGMTIQSGGQVTVNGNLNILPSPPTTPTAGTQIPSTNQIVWNWSSVSGATGYKWNTTNDYGTAIDMGTATTKTETNLNCNTGYTRYVWAYNTGGNSTPVTLAQTTSLTPQMPAAGNHLPSIYQIVWNWNTVVDAAGYKWSTTNNYVTAIDMGPATTITETGLTCNTSYSRYIWAYNVCGISSVMTLSQLTTPCPPSCLSPITDTRDGKTYNTVLIGTQCWFAQNLNVGSRIDRSLIQTNNGTIEKYCYNDDVNNCNVYGGLYQWDETMHYSTTEGAKGICPTSWHLPTDAEWTTLTTFLGGEGVAGGKLKETGLSHWAPPNTGATNSSGFTALPGGYSYLSNLFGGLTYYPSFWSSSLYDATDAWSRYLFFNDESVGRQNDIYALGFSVRCLKD